MLRELVLEAPARLTLTAEGKLAGPLRLANHDFSAWQCTCRLEAGLGLDVTIRFDQEGRARLELPVELTGTLLAVLELGEPDAGGRLMGAFQLTLEPGSQNQPTRTAIYQPLSARGSAVASGALVEDKVMLRIPLVAERPGRAVPLNDLLQRERCMPLPDRGDGTARVITIHAGPSTVLGRCYASQLRGPALDFLAALGEETIHWVTLWDDRWVNKLTTRLEYALEHGDQNLELRNITDYSSARNDVRVQWTAREEERLLPGRTSRFPLQPEAFFTLMVGEGDHQREILSCRFCEARLGKLRVRIPYFKTERTRFRFPPEDPAGLRMHYLGIWLPLALERFEHLLTLAQEPLAIAFPREAVYFWIRYRHGRGVLTVSSNEDLRDGLKR